jgi:hypothetical protein
LRGVPIELVQPVPDPVLVGLGEQQSETFLADLVPCHYLLIEALQKIAHNYGGDLHVELPTGSARWTSLV